MANLTRRVVEGLEPKAADYFEWDDDVSGFGVRVWPSGRKVYMAQYRAGGRTRRIKLGSHGHLTVEEARRQAKAVLGDVARGEDPAEERATRRKSLTVRELCDSYLVAAGKGLITGKGGRPKKGSTIYVDKGRIERHIVPLLGAKLVIDLTASDLGRFQRDVASGRTAAVQKTGKRGKAVVEGGIGTASRTVGLLGGILSFAVSEGIITDNPARGLKRPADNKRKRRLSADEYRRLGDALAAAEADRDTEQGIAAIWLLALTGCRLSEIIGLRWKEVDDEQQCLRLADTKEGDSVRPIGKPVLEVLARTTRTKSPYVLPAVRGAGPFGGMPRQWKRILERAEIEGATPHTLRHSFGSVAGDLGFADSTIGALLGHAAATVTSLYVHRLDSVMLTVADKVARDVRRQMTGEQGTVVELPTKRRRRG